MSSTHARVPVLGCLGCGLQSVVAGVLCGSCVSRLCGSTPLCPEQVVSIPSGRETADAGLIDRWGRVALLESPTELGRDADSLSILEPSVSRLHAVLERTGSGGWQVRDQSSSNGTTVNGKRVTQADLNSGDVLFCGEVGFLFVSPVSSPVSKSERPPASHATWAPGRLGVETDDDETFPPLQVGDLTLAEHSGGAGGVLQFGDDAVQLTLVQYELFVILRARMCADRGRDDRIRGFIRSSELLACLSWNTARADENNLKQLIRRVRRTLARAAVPDLIEARHGFGYRLRVRVDY
jgi:hypothetical protein